MSMHKVRSLGPQEAHIVDVARPITKYAAVVEDASEVEKIMDEAIRMATTGRPGPVWVDVPLNIQNAPYVDPCEEVGKMLAQAERPLIVAGNGINCAKGRKDFINFVNKTQMPVATTYNGIDLIPSDPVSYTHLTLPTILLV